MDDLADACLFVMRPDEGDGRINIGIGENRTIPAGSGGNDHDLMRLTSKRVSEGEGNENSHPLRR